MTNQPEQIQITADELPEVKRLLERLRAERAIAVNAFKDPLGAVVMQLNRIEGRIDRLTMGLGEAVQVLRELSERE